MSSRHPAVKRSAHVVVLITAVALTIALVSVPDRTRAQTPLPFFTLAVIPDIHLDDSAGNPVAVNRTAWATAKAWIQTHAYDATWNIQGVMGLGDLVADANTGPTGDWQSIAADADGLATTTGLPTVWNSGNHDISQCCASPALWNTYIGPTIDLWPLTHKMTGLASGYPSYSGLNTYQYKRVDVPTTRGTVKLGMVGLEIYSSPTQTATARSAWMDPDTDRQFVVSTHMFWSETPGAWQSFPCVHDAAGTNECNSTSGINAGLGDGATTWSALKDNPRILAIVNGHSHNDSTKGRHSGQVTGTAGNTVYGFSTYSVGFTGWGTLLLLKFRTDNNSIEVYSWRTATDTADPTYFGSPVVIPWRPMGLKSLFPLPL